MFINNINPVLFQFWIFEIRYYGLFIVLGIIISFFIIRYLVKKKGIDFNDDELLDLTLWIVIGILIGARAFYVIIYDLPYYLSNLFSVFAIWNGGLSFHGGIIGALLGGYLFCRIKKKDFLQIADIVIIPVAFALFLGRIANFLNSELVGRVTSLPWGVNFNNEKDALGNLVYRHPSQLYEAGKNLLIFGVLWSLKDKNFRKGTILGVFILMYSTLRFFIEFFRQPDAQLGFMAFGLTMGQIINIMMFGIGAALLYYIYKIKPE